MESTLIAQRVARYFPDTPEALGYAWEGVERSRETYTSSCGATRSTYAFQCGRTQVLEGLRNESRLRTLPKGLMLDHCRPTVPEDPRSEREILHGMLSSTRNPLHYNVCMARWVEGGKLGEIAEDHTISIRYVSHILTKVRKSL